MAQVRRLAIGLVLGVGLVVALHLPASAQQANRLDITIRNYTYQFKGSILKPNFPVVIVVENLDKVTHGFMSPLFSQQDVEVESRGVTTYGRGIKGVHIDPGTTVTIRFTPTKPGRFTFNCDIHPKMKGEVLLLSIGEV